MVCQNFDPLQKCSSIESLYALVGGAYGLKGKLSDVEPSSHGLNLPFISDEAILDKFIALCEEGKGETTNREKILWLRNKLQTIDVKNAAEKITRLNEVVKRIFSHWKGLWTLGELLALFPQLTRIDPSVAEQFRFLFVNPKFTFIPFRTIDGFYYLFSRDGVRPSCDNLEDPLSHPRLHVTTALKNSLEDAPLEVAVFINSALLSEQLVCETLIEQIGTCFCFREADGSFMFLNKIPSPQPCYLVDDGSLVFTPTKTHASLMNLSVKVDASYIKLRNLTVYPRALKICHDLDEFETSRWFSIGTGEFALLLDKKEIGQRLQLAKISLEQRHKLIARLLLEPFSYKVRPVGVSQSPDSEFIEEPRGKIFALLQEGYKITTILSPERNFFILALQMPKEGCVKIVKKALIVFGKKEKCTDELGQSVAIGKGKKEVNKYGEEGFCKVEILKEAAVAQGLMDARIPYILHIYPLKRSDDKKAGILMEHCEGDLEDYGNILSRQQGASHIHHLPQECRTMLIQAADALIGMHRQGWIHGDVKLANMLYKRTATGQLEVRLCDFGGTNRIPALVYDIVATYPPPEFLQELEEQKIKYTLSCHVPRTPEGDAWAFGIAVYTILKGEIELLKKLDFLNNSCVVIEGAKKICAGLEEVGPISDLIRGLLEPNPQARMPLEKAKELLL